MAKAALSPTKYAQQQSVTEWLADYESPGCEYKPTLPAAVNLQAKQKTNTQNGFQDSARNAGIVSVRYVGERLLVYADRHITPELNSRIKTNIQRLAGIAEPDTGKSLFEFVEYRTFMSLKKPCLAVVFSEVNSGAIAERYFNIELMKKNGKSLKTGVNCEFRIVGNFKRPQEGMFIKFWRDSVKHIPDNRPSHIYRYMNTMLSGVAVSCTNTLPHHGITKLTKLKYEGHLYEIK